MNLYLISQDKNNDYDTFDSAVVAANNVKEAQMMHPYDFYGSSEKWLGEETSTWCRYNHVDIKLLGKAKKGTVKSVILASFNAG